MSRRNVEHRLFSDTLSSLDGLLEESWTQLEAAARAGSHGWHMPVLSTIENDHPRSRMVVMRGADRDSRTIWCHTDARSSKIDDVRLCPEVAWLFYDTTNRVQASIHASATIHIDDAIAQNAWDASRLESLRCYLAPRKPGISVESQDVNLPAELITRPPSSEEAAEGRDNFAVVRTTVTSLELLYLKQSGNVRARFTWNDDAWHKTWITP